MKQNKICSIIFIILASTYSTTTIDHGENAHISSHHSDVSSPMKHSTNKELELTLKQHLDKFKADFLNLLNIRDYGSLETSLEKKLEKELEKQLEVIKNFFFEHLSNLSIDPSDLEDFKSKLEKQLSNISAFLEPSLDDQDNYLAETDFEKIITEQLEDIRKFFVDKFKFQPSQSLTQKPDHVISHPLSSQNVFNVVSPKLNGSSAQPSHPESAELKRILQEKDAQKQPTVSPNSDGGFQHDDIFTHNATPQETSFQGDQPVSDQHSESDSHILQVKKKEFESKSEIHNSVPENAKMLKKKSADLKNSKFKTESSNRSHDKKPKRTSQKKQDPLNAKTAVVKDIYQSNKPKTFSFNPKERIKNDMPRFNLLDKNLPITDVSKGNYLKHPNQMGDDPNVLSHSNEDLKNLDIQSISNKQKVFSPNHNGQIQMPSKDLIVSDYKKVFNSDGINNLQPKSNDNTTSVSKKYEIANEISQKNSERKVGGDTFQIDYKKNFDGKPHNFAVKNNDLNDLKTSKVDDFQNLIILNFTVSQSK